MSIILMEILILQILRSFTAKMVRTDFWLREMDIIGAESFLQIDQAGLEKDVTSIGKLS